MNLDSILSQRAKVEEFRRKHRIGLLTLLFTDLVGSTRLKQHLGDHQAVALIQQHHTLVREILAGFTEGEEISTAGDSFFIVFAKPSDTVKFALELQCRLRRSSPEFRRLLVDRIGIHIGEVMVEERVESSKPKDLYGLQVDICARVMSLAEGNQILLTRSAFDNARQVLKGEEIEGVGTLSWLNHGAYVLKGVDEPLEICEVGEEGFAALKPPADSQKVHRYVSLEGEPLWGWRPASGQAVPQTQWLLEEKLGEGNFGEVWLGYHQKLKERRVFKFCFRADRVRPLKREVTLFRLLKERLGEHPRIVRLHDVFFDAPPYYVVTDYVEGRDLRSWAEMQGGLDKIPLVTRLEIVAQVADALQAAHEAGVIHRDVKPGNILIGNQKDEMSQSGPQVKLSDFGLGQVVAQEALSGLSKSGFTHSILVSDFPKKRSAYMYMAPEILSGQPPSIRSDIFSLGVVLYQVIVGDFTRPVSIDSLQTIDDPVLRDDLEHCLAGNPEARIQTAGELAQQLRLWPMRRTTFQTHERMMSSAIIVFVSLAVGIGLRLSPFGAGLARFSHNFFEAFLPGAILNLGQADDLVHLPLGLELSILVVAGLIWGIVLPRLRMRFALAVGMMVMAVIAPMTSLFLAKAGFRLAWAIVSIEIAAAFLGMLLFHRTRSFFRKRLLHTVSSSVLSPQ